MSKYSSNLLASFFKLTGRFDNPNIKRAHSHLSSRIDGGLDDISIAELQRLHQIRRLFESDDEAIEYILAQPGDSGVSESDVRNAEKQFGISKSDVGSEADDKNVCSKCGIRILGNATICPVCDAQDPYTNSSSNGSSSSSSSNRCPNCNGEISPTILRCVHCGHVRTLPKKKEAQGCATAAGWLIPIAIFVGLGFGLKSCVGMFSEESRDAVRKDRYDNCVEVARNRAAAACSINACDVGCQIENLDNPLAITRCINNCREWSPEKQEKLCEDAQSTVLWTAIQECPR